MVTGGEKVGMAGEKEKKEAKVEGTAREVVGKEEGMAMVVAEGEVREEGKEEGMAAARVATAAEMEAAKEEDLGEGRAEGKEEEKVADSEAARGVAAVAAVRRALAHTMRGAPAPLGTAERLGTLRPPETPQARQARLRAAQWTGVGGPSWAWDHRAAPVASARPVRATRRPRGEAAQATRAGGTRVRARAHPAGSAHRFLGCHPRGPPRPPHRPPSHRPRRRSPPV